MASACLPECLHTIIDNLTEQCLTYAQTNMALGHKRKIIFLLHQSQVLISQSFYSIATNSDSEVLSHSGYNLFLLGLVINDRYFFLERIQELLPEERIASSYDDSLRVCFGVEAADGLPDDHHCRIAHLRITLGLYLALLAHRHETPQHVALGNYDVFHQQVSVILCLKAYFWTNIAHLYSGQRFQSGNITNGHDECMNSLFLPLDYHLREDQGMRGEDA